ncbi:diguanylate cyclase domain-containing protein [Sphingomonas sp. Marseille-Q8236]
MSDLFGHGTGDAMLRAFAKALQATVPPSAIIARTGGEDFAILLDRTTIRGAALVAEAIQRSSSGL